MPGHGVAALVQNLCNFAIVPVVQHRFDNMRHSRWYRVKKIAHDHEMALATPNIDESVESARGYPAAIVGPSDP